jgi:hypothetical protein
VIISAESLSQLALKMYVEERGRPSAQQKRIRNTRELARREFLK